MHIMREQKTEFFIGLSDVEGCKKYSPKAAGVNGRVWTRHRLKNGKWLHEGKAFVSKAAEEAVVHMIVDEKLDGKVDADCSSYYL